MPNIIDTADELISAYPEKKASRFYFVAPFILQKLLWLPLRLTLRFFGNLEIYGLNNLGGINKNAIFASNHISELDPLLIPVSLPFFTRFSPMFYVSKEQKFYAKSGWRQMFYGGFLFKLLGSYPVSPDQQNYRKSLAHHIDILNDKGSLCFFPEGKTSLDGMPTTGKGGIGYLVSHTSVAVVPVAVSGVHRINIYDFLLGRCRIKIVFGAPLFGTDLIPRSVVADKKNQYQIVSQSIMSKISDLFFMVRLEHHNSIVRFFRLFTVPSLNALPARLIKTLMKKSSHDAGAVVDKGGTTHALEAMYTRYHRKIFDRGLLEGAADLFWHHMISQPKSLRNRLKLVSYELEKIIVNRVWRHNSVNILSIAGGSARSIMSLIESLKRRNADYKINVTVIDKDESAIAVGKQLSNSLGISDQFTWINGNAKEIRNYVPNEKFDIVEIVGLLDYFDVTRTIDLLSYCHSIMNEQGKIIIANVFPNNEMKFVEKTGWPKMYYRGIHEVKDLLTQSGYKDSDIIIEPLSVHTVAVANK